MDNYGIWSLIPPLVAILLAIKTRQVFVSLLSGIWLGWVVVNHGNLWLGTMDTLQALVNVFADAGNTRTIMFCALVGGLILFIQRSGGVDGFIHRVHEMLERHGHRTKGGQRALVQFFAWLTGLIIFVESSISVLTVGALYRPLFDKLGIPREKLAYISDSTSAPSSILIPFNAWGAFIMGLLAMDFDNPFSAMFHAMAFNFYPILAILLVLLVIFSGKDIGPMKEAERRAREEGKLLADGAQPMISEDLTEVEAKKGVKPRAMNMIIPVAMMVLLMPVMLSYTGWQAAVDEMPEAGFWQKAFFAIGQGSGSTAVLSSVTFSLLGAMLLYRVQGIMKMKEMIELTLKGISGLMPLALLMMLAFAISSLCRTELHTGEYVAGLAQGILSPGLVPFIVFLLSCFIAFSTGTSWGTFAIMMAIALPMADQLGASPYLTIAAVMGGGVFGDHCSPISDTTILASMASASDHIDHVRTQLPYALLAGGIAAILYLVIGLMFSV